MRRAIKITRSVAYAGRPRHTLDICRPVDAVAAPVVVFFYGGGWRRGNKRLYRYVAKALARRGYVAVVPDYRIYPEARYPDFIEDAALAVRWVKETRRASAAIRKKSFCKATRPAPTSPRCWRLIGAGCTRSAWRPVAILSV